MLVIKVKNILAKSEDLLNDMRWWDGLLEWAIDRSNDVVVGVTDECEAAITNVVHYSDNGPVITPVSASPASCSQDHKGTF